MSPSSPLMWASSQQPLCMHMWPNFSAPLLSVGCFSLPPLLAKASPAWLVLVSVHCLVRARNLFASCGTQEISSSLALSRAGMQTVLILLGYRQDVQRQVCVGNLYLGAQQFTGSMYHASLWQCPVHCGCTSPVGISAVTPSGYQHLAIPGLYSLQ